MNQLGIVTRACLREAEETHRERAKRYAKTAAKVAGAGALALGGLGAIRGARLRYPLAGVGSVVPRLMLYPYQGVKAGLQQGVGVRDKLSKAAAWGIGGLRDVPRGQKVGAIGSAAAYGGYKLYKHLQAKRAAAQAAKEAYYATYQTLMESEDGSEEPSTLRKWGGRALKAGAIAGGMYGLHRGLRSNALKKTRVGSAYRNAYARVKSYATGVTGAGKMARGSAYSDLPPVD